MPWIAKNADDQLGKLIDALKAKGELDEHAHRRARRPRLAPTRKNDALRATRPAAATCSWYYDPNTSAPTPTYGRRPAPEQRRRPGAAERHRQPRVQLPVHRHRGVARSTAAGPRRLEAAAVDEDACPASSPPTSARRRPLRAALSTGTMTDVRVSAGGRCTAQELVDTMAFDGRRRRGRPAQGPDQLRRLRRPRRRAEGRAAHPDGRSTPRASSTSVSGAPFRLVDVHADGAAGDGHPADGADGRPRVQPAALSRRRLD